MNFSIIKKLFSQPLSEEALVCYFQKLPESIEVKWFRDGNYIIGEVSDGNKSFTTQGKESDDFIEIVNDGLLGVYDIPVEYYEALKKVRAFSPDKKEYERLASRKVCKSKFGSKKFKAELQLA